MAKITENKDKQNMNILLKWKSNLISIFRFVMRRFLQSINSWQRFSPGALELRDRHRDVSRVLYQVRGEIWGEAVSKETREEKSGRNDDVTADFNHAFQHKGTRAEIFRVRGRRGAMEISDPFTQRESEALIKGSALHLHLPGVIYRTRGKMNGRIKMASTPTGRRSE